jgi:hypothetical protein
VLRRTILVGFASAAALAVVVSAGGAPNRAAADPFVGTWTIVPKAGTPWASGGTITISASSRSEVKALGPAIGNNGYESQCIGFENPPWPPGSGENPTVSAWYVAAFSWTSPKMGGCISNKTGPNISLFGNPRQFVGLVNPVLPNGTIHGCWSNNFALGCTFFDSVVQEEGTTTTVSEPAPGKSAFIESPNLPVDCGSNPGRTSSAAQSCKLGVGVTSSGGDLEGTLFGELGSVERRAAVLLVSCWIIDFHDKDGKVISVSPGARLRFCIAFVRYCLIACGARDHRHLDARTSGTLRRRPEVPVGRGATSGCRTQRMTIALRLRKGKVVSAKAVKNKPLTASSVRYTCTASGNTAKITLTGPAKLRKALGTKKLPLGVYRAPKAPHQSGKLSITFGW